MIGEVGGMRDNGLDVKSVEMLARQDVSLNYTCFQKLPEVLKTA